MRRAAMIALCSVAICGCQSDPNQYQIPVPESDGGAVASADAAGGDAAARSADAGAALSIIGAIPSQGPFVGGTKVTIHGSGFAKGAKVHFGKRQVQARYVSVKGPTAIEVITPAGDVGPVDVTVALSDRKAVLRKGFRYDPFSITPSSGPTAGGTLVTIQASGVQFDTSTVLQLDGRKLTDLEVVKPTTLRAKTPPGLQGPADLQVDNKKKRYLLKGAYRYYATSNPASGGLGGGAIKGTLTVSVLAAQGRAALPKAKVVLARAKKPTETKTTDAKGVAVFTATDLAGPVTVTAAKKCFEPTTITQLDARDVTILLFADKSKANDPDCKGQPKQPPTLPPLLPGKVKGFVLFEGLTGHAANEWRIVPKPAAGKVKRVYVFTTNADLFVTTRPKPELTAIIDYKKSNATAWPYSRTTRTGTQAVYALAGIFDKSTLEFVPYAIGVKRGVVVGPGETVRADVIVDTALDQTVTVKLKDVPPQAGGLYQARLAIDLGADGVIDWSEMSTSGYGKLSSLSFKRQPAFLKKGLIDASYSFDLTLYATSGLYPMFRATEQTKKPNKGTLTVGGFVGAATASSPYVATNNTLRWTTTTGAAPSLSVTMINSGSRPVWRIISRGSVKQVKLPDPKSLGLDAWPTGAMTWRQWQVHLPSYDFDTFNYRQLSSRYWDRWSFNYFSLYVVP